MCSCIDTKVKANDSVFMCFSVHLCRCAFVCAYVGVHVITCDINSHISFVDVCFSVCRDSALQHM
jgi:hypothetical protein